MQEASNAKSGLGVLLLMPFFTALILLYTFTGETFASALVFLAIFAASIVALLAAKSFGYEPVKWISGKFDKNDLKYIGIGFAGLIAVVFITTSIIEGTAGILTALFFGGIVLMFSLYKSESFIVPLIAHAIYNITVVLLAGGVFSFLGLSATPLSASPIVVPSFGFSFPDINTDALLQLALMQLAFVSLAETLLKISVATGAALLFSRSKPVMFGVAIALWTVLHNIQSYT